MEHHIDTSCCHTGGTHTGGVTHTAHAEHSAMNHGSAQDFLRRFIIVTILLVPLLLTDEMVTEFFGIGMIPFGAWAEFAIATVIFGFSLIFFKHALHEIRARKYGMMTLVSLAVGAGYFFSVASTFIPEIGTQFYLEISTLIWVLLFGHYLEARSSAAAGNALAEVAKLLPKKAHRVRNGKEEDIDVPELAVGDTVIVRHGEKIPADGTVESGLSNVDESLISGESKPIEKKKGDFVVAGSVSIDGALTVTLTRVGEYSTVGQIQKLVGEAQRTKPRSQRIADTASAALTFIAVVVALLTLLVWSVLLGESFVFAMTLAITVLVIACPHALGLAIPAVTTITTTLAVRNGIFIKNLAKIETIRKAEYVIFDKTGTLTKGEFGVTDIVPLTDVSGDDVLRIAASVDRYSSHVIGRSIVRYAEERGIEPDDVSDFKNISGKGSTARSHGSLWAVGNKALMEDLHISLREEEKEKGEIFSAKGKTVIYVSDEKRLVGIIALSDNIKAESFDAVRALHRLGVKVAMLTGDTESVAKGVAEELGIDTYFAGVLPKDKYSYVKKLQGGGAVVLMVGDGVNDAPALTQADAGIAIGAGTDLAVEAGDVVLMRNNPSDVARLVMLARKVYRKMIQNLAWALGYNIIAIPAAAGAFAAWGIFLRPEIGALAMSLSTVIVVINALSLKRMRLALPL
ncbi:MAG: heavy metal translocating P-type ATPase [Patescibacteria group bacterium]